MDSIERLVRKNAFEPSRLFATAEERATVFSRVEALAHRDRLVGFAWSALKEAYYGEHSRSLLLLEYDILCQRPREAMRLVYEFWASPGTSTTSTRSSTPSPSSTPSSPPPGCTR